MKNNPLLKIRDYGQSIWMDYLDRELIESGELQKMIEIYGLRGITSNPAIFEKAIVGNKVYDTDIEAGMRAGKSVPEIYESLIFEDIRNACDLFSSVYQESGGRDGYVSVEVSPYLARDTQGTIDEVLRFYRAINRENVKIKIPGTPEGFPAVEKAIASGINVNVTLLFSVNSYLDAASAYMAGLEARIAAGQPISKIHSVASFFLSRIDTKVDRLIDERLKNIDTEEKKTCLSAIKGKVAIANAKIAYQKYEEIIDSNRWQALAEKDANIQRLLWASTSTKNPAYSDVMYVNELVAPNTVNTLPPTTIKACADHCHVSANRIETGIREAYRLMESLNKPEIDIDLDRVMAELLEEGIDKFARPFQSLMESIKSKVKRLSPV